jgi:hypothetical protein
MTVSTRIIASAHNVRVIYTLWGCYPGSRSVAPFAGDQSRRYRSQTHRAFGHPGGCALHQ